MDGKRRLAVAHLATDLLDAGTQLSLFEGKSDLLVGEFALLHNILLSIQGVHHEGSLCNERLGVLGQGQHTWASTERVRFGLWGARSTCCFGSKPPVQEIEKRSMARCLSCFRSPSAALPRTAVTQTSAGYRANRPLYVNERESAWQHPPAPFAAESYLIRLLTPLLSTVEDVSRYAANSREQSWWGE
jgi:hypothetical protein